MLSPKAFSILLSPNLGFDEPFTRKGSWIQRSPAFPERKVKEVSL